jgi:hypothetical protein
MTRVLTNISKWSARILAILLTGLMLMFIFSGTETIMDMMIMALPGFFLLGSTLLAWFRPIPGGMVYILLGGFALFFFHAYESIVTVILLFGVPVTIGLLFLVSAQKRESGPFGKKIPASYQ